MTRDETIRMLKALIEFYALVGDDHYISTVRDSCEVAFNTAAAERGWKKIAPDDLR